MHPDQMRIQAAWERYVAGGEELPDRIDGVRPDILDSWRRSRQAGANPFVSSPERLSAGEMRQTRQHHETLIAIAMPYLRQFCRLFQGSGQQILLTDGQGRQLRLLTDGQDGSQLTRRAQIQDGCIYTEEVSGTSAVALCLHAQRPAVVFGWEHYRRFYHGLAGFSVPLRDPSGGLAGCLCGTCALEHYRRDMLSALLLAAGGIENQFRLQCANSLLHLMLEHDTNGVLLLDAAHRVLQGNRRAQEILHLPQQDLTGRQLEELIRSDSLPAVLRGLERDISSLECTLLNREGVPVHVHISVIHTREQTRGFQTKLLFLASQERTHLLTSRMAGYTAEYTFSSIIGQSEQMCRLKQMGQAMARAGSNVLLFGESGTGKELFAQAIHNASGRADGPFVAVNCASLPKERMESELFGCEGGAFPGARAGGNPGKFELANGGTLFLDEIGCMPLEAQAALLRILQTKQVTRLGGKIAKHIDVRILAATNLDLPSAVADGTFRNDLYYRLNVLSLTLPPLRERTQDIPQLISHFLSCHTPPGKSAPSFDEESMQALLCYPWPGNVRELENVIERAVHLATNPVCRLSDLPAEIVNYYLSAQYRARDGQRALRPPAVSSAGAILSPEIQEYRRLLEALRQERGHVKTAAAVLGMPLSTLYRKINKYRLDPRQFRQWSGEGGGQK